jgi:hypothetical protein
MYELSAWCSHFIETSAVHSELEEETALEILNNNLSFLSGLKRILREDGILVLNVASDFRAVDSQAIHQAMSVQHPSRILQSLEELGFVDVKQYEETLSGFPDSKHFVVAFKETDTAKNWNRNEAQVNRMIHSRLAETKSGKPPLRFLDGSSMVSYSKFEHAVGDCAEHPNPRWCDIKRQVVAFKPKSGHLVGELRRLEAVVLPNSSEANLSLNEASQCTMSEALNDGLACDAAEQRLFVGHESS